MATSEIDVLVATLWVAEIRARDGRCLLRVDTFSSTFVAGRLRSALAHVREPRSYCD